MAKKLLLNPIRRRVILENFHKFVHELPKRPEYKIAIDNVYNLLLPIIIAKYPQDDMKILSLYNTAFPLGTLVSNRTTFSLNVGLKTNTSVPISYDLNGLLFPYHYIKSNCHIQYQFKSSVNDPSLKVTYSDDGTRIQPSFPIITLESNLIEQFHFVHGMARREIDFPNDIYYKYSKLVYASRTFEDLVDINPSFEKFRSIAENPKLTESKKKHPNRTRCIINEDQVKSLIDEPFIF